MRRVISLAVLATAAVVPCSRANAQAPSRPFLTGSCAPPDSMADMSDVVDQPDRPPALVPGMRIPAFPESVQRAGYKGSVLVGFIVDTTGHVRRGSVVVLSSTDSGLSRWACDAVPLVRLDPARSQGHLVAAQAVMPFMYNGPPVTMPGDSVPHVIDRPQPR